MDTKKIDKKDVKTIAHRGLSGIERENTFPAFVAAGNRSYFGIETDVHLTADGKFVIIHDETLNRVSNGEYTYNVEKECYGTLSHVVLPDLDDSRNRQDIRIPLLVDYIKICKKYEKVCVLELKNPFSEENIVKLIKEITDLGYIENVIFISFVRENCLILRKHLLNNEIQWLTSDPVGDEEIQFLVENKLELDIYYAVLDKEIIDMAHSNNIKINCWTCDDIEAAKKIVELGVDYITTNILE